MSILQKKRVSAAEAADILGVPRATISRIDRQGEIIRRYKIGHKTFVYDVESLEQFLLANEVRPARPPTVSPVVRGRTPYPKDTVSLPGEPKQSLREFLQGKRKEWSEQDKTVSSESSRRRR
ncbi:helix-turn-helix domain-containing protein [Burkholderia cenocepacia]|uniref:helix-turn-helix transcriptional regulator n=1 Tax=Burkholderia cenocepacia TaxID=95486 RepID=UPI00285DAE97|nr:helix-turn-helix domain-containing protein [Burkholderia cenocepacia]MDR5660980.1 helix-turn-helix domain-containing protein [Burkholderia cenocepacia]MDR8094138.1 helix-turn-helix domain-containing protein [Burkholderia cenocepacia]